MRELKFRAWEDSDYDTRMIYDIFIGSGDGGCFPVNGDWDDIVNIDQLEIMQYTGLKDKNGKEIYEGDIVVFQDKSHIIGRHKAVYTMSNKKGFLLLNYEQDELDIIGNIYENPELINN